MLIDAHAHLLTPGMLNRHDFWGPFMKMQGFTVGHFALGTKQKSKAASDQQAEANLLAKMTHAARRELMAQRGVDQIVVSTPSHAFMYWADDFGSEYARICTRSIESEALASTALAGVSINTPFELAATNTLAPQLKMVANLIGARSALGAKRQVFMVSLGGFDNHSDLAKLHPALLTKVASAMASFYKALEELGVANNVVTFTASDFGRTLTSNSSGSDHGWGSMQFVMGGGVKGKNFYGQSPVFANNGPDDFGQGRLVPSTSVDQLAATMATWFGVSNANLRDVMPSIVNFSQKNLGFMA